MRMGLWIEEPGRYAGFFGFAAGEVFVPMTFAEPELHEVIARARDALPGAIVEARPAPEALPWNEA